MAALAVAVTDPASRRAVPLTMDDDTKDPKDITAPPAPTHEAGAPPSSPEPDDGDVAKGEDKLRQAGAGH